MTVVALDAPRRAVFTWRPDAESPPTTVEFAIAEIPAGVRVTVHETGFAAFGAAQHAANYEANRSGWRQELALAATALGSA
ncbi:SRPBCC domain-containing protein [Microbacterium indicum]|uniref:SRPBCC domain-containing protein n=1 Tax=Microbacterium indicum TaxID=358100 RepID=UPI00042299B9|nr:SRPBCC domain-containing protein [Microbacterium indicum]